MGSICKYQKMLAFMSLLTFVGCFGQDHVKENKNCMASRKVIKSSRCNGLHPQWVEYISRDENKIYVVESSYTYSKHNMMVSFLVSVYEKGSDESLKNYVVKDAYVFKDEDSSYHYVTWEQSDTCCDQGCQAVKVKFGQYKTEEGDVLKISNKSLEVIHGDRVVDKGGFKRIFHRQYLHHAYEGAFSGSMKTIWEEEAKYAKELCLPHGPKY